MPDRIQRNKTTGEMRIVSEDGTVRPYTPAAPASNGPEMYHAGPNDTPGTAFMQELSRTGKEALTGLVSSPLDFLTNTVKTVAHPLDAISNTAHAVANPGETIQALGDNPREAGSLIGQLLLGQYAVPAAAARAPGAISAVGRGAEAVGTGLTKFKGGVLPGLAATEAVMRGDPWGAAAAATPYALKYGGKGLQKVGDTLESWRAPKRGPVPTVSEVPMPQETNLLRPARVSTEKPGFSYKEPAAAALVAEPPTNVSGLRTAAETPKNSPPSAATADQAVGSLMSKFPSEVRGLSQEMVPSEFGIASDNPEWFANAHTLGEADLPAFSFEGEASMYPGEFPPGPSVDLPNAAGLKAAAAAPAPLPSEPFGPNSTLVAGAEAQGGSSANLLHDPRYSTDELVNDLGAATDPFEQDYLRRAISQRRVILRKLAEAGGR